MDVFFRDGTKIEANANRYIFVWRGEKNRKRKISKLRSVKFDYNISPYAKPAF